MGNRNLLAGAVLLAVGAGYAWATTMLPDRSLPDTPGPAFFPTLVVIGLLGLSATLALRGFLTLRGQRRTTDGYRMPPRGWLALGGFAAFLALLPYAGFAVAGVPFFGGLMVLYGERRTPVIVLTAIAVPVALFLVFTAGFRILLPGGSWW